MLDLTPILFFFSIIVCSYSSVVTSLFFHDRFVYECVTSHLTVISTRRHPPQPDSVPILNFSILPL